VSDLLLTKLLPEMEGEAQRPGDAGDAAGEVAGASSSASVQQRTDSLKRRVASHNALLADALLHAEDEDRSRDAKKQRQA
jgi:hypothetical protein